MLAHHRHERGGGFSSVREDRLVVEEAAGAVDHRAFASGAEPRVDAEHGRSAERRSEQQGFEVGREDIHRLDVRLLFELVAHLLLHARTEQTPERITSGFLELTAKGRVPLQPHDREEALLEPVRLDDDVRLQEPLGLSAKHGEEAMRGDATHGLLVADIGLELGARLGFASGRLRAHATVAPVGLARCLSRSDVLRDGFGDDVSRALQRGVDVGDFLGHVGARRLLWAPARRLREDEVGERLQASLTRDAPPRLPLLLVWEVEILELVSRGRGEQRRSQLRRELSLLFDGPEDDRAPLLERDVLVVLFLDGADLHLVEVARSLLAVARDEGDRRALREERDDRAHTFEG